MTFVSSRPGAAAVQPVCAGALHGEVSKALGRIAAHGQALSTCRTFLPGSWVWELSNLHGRKQRACSFPHQWADLGRAGPILRSSPHLVSTSAPHPKPGTPGWGSLAQLGPTGKCTVMWHASESSSKEECGFGVDLGGYIPALLCPHCEAQASH